MKRTLLLSFVCLLVSSALCQAQQKTLISDTLFQADGSKAQGTATITWPPFTSQDNFPIAQGTLNITISNGAIAVQLVPTQGATPSGTSYTVNYFLANSVSYTEYWTVPTTGPVTLTQVRTTPVPVPTTTFGEQQLTLGNGLQTLLGVWKQSTGPVPNAEGQCYWNTTNHAVMCTDQTLTFNALGGSDPTRVSKAGDTMSGSLVAANTNIQLGSLTNPFGALFQNQSSGATFNTTQINSGGQNATIADGLAGNNTGDRAAIHWLITTDGTTSPPNFSNQEALFLNFISTNGQNDSDQSAKKTFFGILNRNAHYAAGQRIGQGNQLTCYGMGDCLETSDAVTMFGGLNASGDEGTAFRSMNLLQGSQLAVTTIVGNSSQTTCNTTTTQAITKNIAAQQVTVASTTGCNVGDWVVLGEGAPALSDFKVEAVQLSAVSSGVITAVFVKNHVNGDTVTPSTRLILGGTANMGQLRYLVNLSQPSYSAGTVSSISGRNLTGNGTNWTASMAGGNTNDGGCITMPADDYSASPFTTGSPLRAWYPIQSVSSPASLTISHVSAIGGTAYSGKGPGSGAYSVAPCARILSFAFSSTAIGNTVILENNSFTWNVGDTVEAVFSVDGDVAGEYLRAGWFMPGASLRSLYSAVNIGAQPFSSAFATGSQMTTPNTTAFQYGMFLGTQMGTGIEMSGPTTSGIGIGMINSPGDNKAIAWSNGAIYEDASTFDLVLTRGLNDGSQPSLTLTRPSTNPSASTNIFGNLQVSFNTNPKIRLQSTVGSGATSFEFRNMQTGSFFPAPDLEVYADSVGRSLFGIYPGFGLLAINSLGPATLAGNSSSYNHSYTFETFNGVSSDLRYVHTLVVPASGVISTATVAPVEWQLRTSMNSGVGIAPFAGISNSGTLRFGNPAQGLLSLNASAISSARTLTAPDTSGTIALTTAPGTSGTAPNWSATGGLSIPLAASGGTTAGLLSNSDYLLFSGKQNALTFTTPLSASNNTISCPNCEVTTSKNIASGYAGLTSSTKLVTSQGQQVWAVTDLTTYTSTSGHGSTALQATISSPTSGQVLTWSGTDWVNQTSLGVTHSLLSALHTDTTPASVVRGDLITGQGSTTTWQRLPLGSSGRYLRSNGTDVAYSSVAAGGVGSCAANQWVNATNDNATPSCSQPTFSNLGGTSNVVLNNQANTFSTGLQDLSAASAVLPKSGDPGSPATGQVWINSGALKYRDNSGSPATQTVEVQSNKNQANGYAGLTAASVLAAAQFPALTGDITTSAGSLTTTLPNIVTAGTNTKITYNAKGQVTGSAQAAATDLSNGTSGSGAIALTSGPTLTDVIVNQNANGDDTIAGKRKTDTSPTGNLFHFQNAAGSADLWTVDVTGTLQSGVIPGAKVSGSVGTASALAATPSQCSANQYATGVAANGNATCAQVAYSQVSGTTNVVLNSQANTYTTGLQDLGAASAVLPKSSDPGSPATGQVWINSGALKYRDNSGSPATQTVEVQGNKNQANGYAGLTAASVLAAAQFPALAGDITTTVGSLTTTLPNIVTANTNTKITYNAKGQVTGSAQAAATDLSNGTTGSGAITLAASPTVSDLVTNQNANGDDTISGKRKTDTSPTGNLLHFQNAAGNTDLWTVDATGTLQSGTVPGARVSGNISGNAGTATALAATPTQCSTNQFSTGITASGNANCTQPTAANLTNGTAGTGSVVLATSPTISTPTISGALGGNLDLGSNGVVVEIANEATTGTTVNQVAKMTGATSTAIKTTTADSTGAIGVVVAGAGTSGNAQIARTGLAACAFDGGTIAGDYVQISSSVAGDCHDAGVTFPLSGQIIGRVLTTNGSSGTFTILVTQSEVQAAPRVFFAGLTSQTLLSGATQFFMATGTRTTPETALQLPVPVQTTARAMYCNLASGTQPASGSLVITLRQNATNPSGGLVVTIPASSTPGVYSDTTHSVALNAGDLIDFQMTNNATGTSANLGGCSIIFQ